MNFSVALDNLKRGLKVARSGWNGKGMWLVLCEPKQETTSGYSGFISGSWPMSTLPFISMKTADDKMVPWLASQTDILAEDWHVLDEPAIGGSDDR